MARFRCLQSGKSGFDGIVTSREALQALYRIIEADDGGFGFRPHDLFGKNNAELAKLRQHGVDARAGLNGDDDGERITANLKMSDFLRGFVIGDDEILLVEIVDHDAALVADSDGRGDERDTRCEFGQDIGRSWLD